MIEFLVGTAILLIVGLALYGLFMVLEELAWVGDYGYIIANCVVGVIGCAIFVVLALVIGEKVVGWYG